MKFKKGDLIFYWDGWNGGPDVDEFSHFEVMNKSEKIICLKNNGKIFLKDAYPTTESLLEAINKKCWNLIQEKLNKNKIKIK